jgi:phage terminase large subunit GpA-like protein
VTALAEVRRRALASLLPPPGLPLSEWIEAHIRLPQGTTAVPGPMKLWPYQRAIADSIADPSVERVALCKAARIGFTSLLTAATGHRRQ